MMKSDWNYEGWDFFYHDMATLPKRVLLTTYGLDAEFLVLELLHWLFQISYPRNSIEWIVEMGAALERCRVDVVVDGNQWVNSSNKDTLFQSLGGRIHPVFVLNGNQHAKLWLAEYDEGVRIAVGSANLTRSGFCEQIQYFWMTDLKSQERKDKPSENLNSLQGFLKGISKAITKSPGTDCSWENHPVYKDWHDVLKGKDWPQEISLIPLIPKNYSDSQDKDALETISGKIQFKKNIVDIQVFDVGDLNQAFVDKIKEAFHANELNLLWPEQDMCYPAWQKMVMSCKTAKNWNKLTNGEIHPLVFLAGGVQDPNDRLPHGKLYAVRRSQEQNSGQLAYDCLLIGSSNFSETAWNDSFELNVLIKQRGLTLPLDRSKRCRVPINAPYCVANPFTKPVAVRSWLEAFETTNGVDVTLGGTALTGASSLEVMGVGGTSILSCPVVVTDWQPGSKQSISCNGKDARRVVVTLTSTQKGHASTYDCPVIPLLDSQIAAIAPPGKNSNVIRHEWILCKYGWDKDHVRPGQYRTPWVEESMNVFLVIDAWRNAGQDSIHKDLLKKAFNFFAIPKPLDVGPSQQSNLQIAFSVAAQEIDEWKTP